MLPAVVNLPLPSSTAAEPSEANSAMAAGAAPTDVDLERRFGGLRRLLGDAGYRRVRAARVAVVGLGGVGSWAAEALARSGVAGLVLIDLDHVSESNINRQVQALGSTLGLAKVDALARRVHDIHPGCAVEAVDDFVEAANWPALLPHPVDAVIDACDQVRAKEAIAAWSLGGGAPLVVVGAAGGKVLPQAVEAGDLLDATHDPLLASLRQRLRRSGAVPRDTRCSVRAVFSREPVRRPLDGEAACAPDGTLNCQGYGSIATVTATFGMVAAAEALRLVQQGHGASDGKTLSPTITGFAGC